jgi:hypothetical protein
MEIPREVAWANRKKVADMLRAAALILETPPSSDPQLASEDWIAAAGVCAAGATCLRALIDSKIMSDEEQTRRMQVGAADLLTV